MTTWLVPALAGGVVLAGVAGWVGGRSRLVPAVLLLATAAGISVAIAASRSSGPGAAFTDVHLGSLVISRLAAGIVIGGWAALVLQLGVVRSPGVSAGGAAVAILAGVGCSLALATTGFAPMALLLAMTSALIWIRWVHLAGPLLPLRSLGRQSALVFCALVGAVGLLPSERIGAVPAVLTGLLLVGGLVGVVGLLPLSSWVGAASRVAVAEAAVWRIWMVPTGILVVARVLVASPSGLEKVIQLLLVALGLATAIFWGCAGFRADPSTRYWRVLQADVGVMCVGVASGDAAGLAAVALLIVVHWLVGAALSEPPGARSHLVAWLGLSGVPPFGGFAGRVLALFGAAFMGPVVVALLLIVFGLQLAACASGIREAVRRAALRGPRLGEWIGLVAALASLAAGLLGGPILSALFGLRV
ncbi:MAG: hypothetical protein ABSF27_03635 [Candidatus Dormibacteria bacterium]